MEQGEICIGGVDIRQIATAKLMDMVSFVFQDTFLFYDTLYENIAVGSPDATKDEVVAAAKAFADPENEHKMQMALQSLIKDKTVIVIAHRLSSVISAHKIVVMKEGRIVQCGRHEQLSVAEGVYKNMWDAYTSAYHWKLNKN